MSLKKIYEVRRTDHNQHHDSRLYLAKGPCDPCANVSIYEVNEGDGYSSGYDRAHEWVNAWAPDNDGDTCGIACDITDAETGRHVLQVWISGDWDQLKWVANAAMGPDGDTDEWEKIQEYFCEFGPAATAEVTEQLRRYEEGRNVRKTVNIDWSDYLRKKLIEEFDSA